MTQFPGLGLLKLGGDAGLLADFVGSDSIYLFVTFDRYYLGAVRINGVVAAFPEQVKVVFHQISDKVTSFDRHVELLPAVVR